MRKPQKLIIFALLAFFLIGIPVLADPPVVPKADRKALDRSFAVGEKLTFSLTWMGIRGGTATLEVKEVVRLNGLEAYRIISTARTTPFFSTFFRVEDRVETFLEAAELYSMRFEKHLREGRYRHDSVTVFDQKRLMANYRYVDHGRRKEEASVNPLEYNQGQDYPIPPRVQDELSSFYFYRTQKIIPGTKTFVETFASKKNWQVEVRAIKREVVETPAGTFNTILIEPLLKFEGIFQRKGKVYIWLTDDEYKIPVMLKSKIVIGSIYATLIEKVLPQVKGPLSSEIPEKRD